VPLIRLILWNAEEATTRVAHFDTKQFVVDCSLPSGQSFLRDIAENPPEAVVIDLSRLPSQGRDIAVMLRTRKNTRSLPIVFVDGDPEKVKKIKGLLPDAVYTSWENINEVLGETIINPPKNPVPMDSVFAGYAGAPLHKKLGIKENMAVTLVSAPDNVNSLLKGLPENVTFSKTAQTECDLILWFVRSCEELNRDITHMAGLIENNKIWIAWPKKASKQSSDLTQQLVREAGLTSGLVDYKVCSIDETWSGLLFSRRSKSKTRA